MDPRLPELHKRFFKVWQGTLPPVAQRENIPYLALNFHREAGSIIHMHPNDVVDLLDNLADMPPKLDFVTLYGPPQPSQASNPRLTHLFAGFSRREHAQAMVTRFNDMAPETFDWLQFPICTRTGLLYDRDPETGSPIAVAPLFARPVTAELPDQAPGRGQRNALGESSRTASRSYSDDVEPAPRHRRDELDLSDRPTTRPRREEHGSRDDDMGALLARLFRDRR